MIVPIRLCVLSIVDINSEDLCELAVIQAKEILLQKGITLKLCHLKLADPVASLRGGGGGSERPAQGVTFWGDTILQNQSNKKNNI